MKTFNKMIFYFFTLLLSMCATAEPLNGPDIGQPMPSLLGRTLDDRLFSLRKEIGQPKVINFFWVECVPCKKEMPELASLEKKYSGVKFIAVHTQNEKKEVVEQFVRSLSAAPSNIVLTQGGMQERFGYLGLPHTVIVNSENIVVKNLVGYTPENMKLLAESLNQLVAK
jgi:thiol-disulfide isomerase/thioredoxin